MRLALLLHVLGVVVWVGGMFFAYMALRPAAAQSLEPPQRLKLWEGTFRRFFSWVWLAVALIFGSGTYLIRGGGGFGAASPHVDLMLGIGLVMALIFFRIFFVPYRTLKQAVAAGEWQTAGAALAQIRTLVGVNLVLGLLTIVVAMAGGL